MFPNLLGGNSVMPNVITTFLLAMLATQQGKQLPVHVKNSDTKLAVKVTVDGQPIDFKGVTPQVQGSRILVPIRGVFESMGANLSWNPQTQTVTATRAGSRVVVTVGKSDATINGQTATVETPPILAEGRVMIPLRFLAQSLGAKVEWMGADRTVVIKTKEAPSP